MAFIFTPPFNEGDRQTNPDTGVEYVYIDGAWRALGPDITEEFPELDQRYVKKAGDIMTGSLALSNSRNLTFRKADDSNQFAINPNVNSDYFTNIYTFNSADGNGGVRFRVSQDQGLGSSSYDMLVSLSGASQEIGGETYRGTLSLNRVQTPDSPDQAANKWYVDNAVGDVDLSEYLPLAGGDMTGDINMMNCRLDTFNADGEQTMEIAPSGFIKTRDMLRVVRSDGGPILEGRLSDSSSDIKVKIDSDGYYQFRDRGELYGDVYLKQNKRYIVQGAANTNVAQFSARTDNIARLEPSVSGKTIEIKGVADPTEPRDAINLQYLQGLPYATEDYVDTATEHDLTDDGLQELETNSWTVKQKNQDGNNRTFISIYDGEMNLYNVVTPSGSSNEKWAANKEYADKKVAKTGDTMTGDLNLDGADRAINIENGNRFRLKGKDADGAGRTFVDIQTTDHDGPEAEDAGYRIRIYHLADPTSDYHAANRKYVDEQVASVGGGGGSVPVGSIMIWMNSTAPAGWFKLQGGSFDVSTYPQLHAYLQGTNGYTSGRLPNWDGHYPGEYGDHLAEASPALGKKVAQKTAQPSGGAPKSSTSIPNGSTRTFNGVGNTNAYSNGASRVTIDSGWDSVTRPPTVIVHYIIKHD